MIWAADSELVACVGNSKHAPEDMITRQDMCKVLYRFAFEMKWFEMLNFETALGFGQFEDASEMDGYSREAVHFFSQTRIMLGKQGKLFDPKGCSTRAEFATVLMRVQESLVTE